MPTVDLQAELGNLKSGYGEGRGTDYAGAHDTLNPYTYRDSFWTYAVGQWVLNPGINYRIHRTYLYFDTSAIPVGSIITEVKLYVEVSISKVCAYWEPFNMIIQRGIPIPTGGYYPHYPWNYSPPPENACYYYDYYEGNYGEQYFSTCPVKHQSYVITLSNNIIKSGGMTKLILRNENEINNIPPTYNNSEDINFYQEEAGEGGIPVHLEITYLGPETELENIKATKLAGSLDLYGDITKKNSTIIERGFEFRIQLNEPEAEDTGTEVKEEGTDFPIGEYHLSSWKTFTYLYCAEEDTIWWFRAYCKDSLYKYKAFHWMRNTPFLITNECTDTTSFSTKGHGELTDIGANIVTERGFHIIKEYSGNIFDMNRYLFHGFIVQDMEQIPQYAPNRVLIGWIWAGNLLKVKSTTNIYGYPLEIYEIEIGVQLLDSLFPNDTYKVKAFGKNQLGRGFGTEVLITTNQIIFEPNTENENPGGEDNEPIESPTTSIKTVKVDNLPVGWKVIRIGIRYGRTPSCNEGIVYEDGEWYNGDSITFFIVDLIPGEKYYEKPFFVVEDDEGEGNQFEIEPPGGAGDEWDDPYPPMEPPDLPDSKFPDVTIPSSDLVGIDYALIIREIKCEITADQSIIDKYGRKRTLTIKNNLIQTMEECREIRDNYLDRFKILKLKIEIDYDIPLPFEREDMILLAYGQINYKADGDGIIGAKADGEGVVNGKMSIKTKVRKININAKTEEAILTLELEV